MAKDIDVVYFEYLTLAAVLRCLFSSSRLGRWEYLSASPLALQVCRIVHRVGFIRELPICFDFFYGNIKEPNGTHIFEAVNEDIIVLAGTVADQISDNAYRALEKIIDRKRLNLFFFKIIADKISHSVVFLYAVKSSGQGQKQVVLIDSLWAKTLAIFVKKFGIEAVIVPGIIHHPFYTLRKKVTRRLKGKENRVESAPSPPPSLEQEQPRSVPKAVVTHWYAGRTLSQDWSKRQELFWYRPDFFKPSDVLLYFERKNIVPPLEGVQQMEQMGVGMVSFYPYRHSSAVHVFDPSESQARHLRGLLLRIVRCWMLGWITLKPFSMLVALQLIWFTKVYVLWSDFFKRTGTRVNIYPDLFNPAHIAINQALRAQGGVSAMFQWSHWHFNSAYLSLDADYCFVFDRDCVQYTHTNRSVVKECVIAGYSWDVKSLQLKREAQTAREALQLRGASFIVCFLDENSSDDRYSIISNDRARSIYSFFLQRLLEDPTLGLVFKPGYVHDIEERVIGPLRPLFDQAQATGRLKMYLDGHYKTDTLPAEAASVADITVGLLLSGTVMIETHLTGARGVFLDLEGLYHKDIYRWGKGTLVFDSLPRLWQAMGNYRRDPSGYRAFGDLTPWCQVDIESGTAQEMIAKRIAEMAYSRREKNDAG